jgi:hypothetical protein
MNVNCKCDIIKSRETPCSLHFIHVSETRRLVERKEIIDIVSCLSVFVVP